MTDTCVQLATTFNFNGTEGTSISGTQVAVSGGGPGATDARATIGNVMASGGDVKIHFSTAAESQLLVGFNVLTETKAKGQFKVNDSYIAPKGVGGGGASYDVAIGRGKFQGGRTVIIESVLSDGTSLKSGAIRF